jgi:hypothetical protein
MGSSGSTRRSAAHPFYMRLNQILDEHDFDGRVEGLCEPFYPDEGRPGLPLGLRPALTRRAGNNIQKEVRPAEWGL